MFVFGNDNSTLTVREHTASTSTGSAVVAKTTNLY